jgi:prepilin-type N-terminal cleavage/methylation domain-containing protein
MSRRADERGFTLVELLVAIAILGIIMLPLSGAFSVGLRTINDTSNRLAGSADAQLLTVHFPADVQGATEGTTTVPAAACTGAENPKLQLTDGGGATAMNVVYGVRASGSAYQVVRYDCAGGSVVKSTVVARNVPSVGSVTAGRKPTTGTFTGATLQLTERVTASDSAPYVFTVEGRRRAS